MSKHYAKDWFKATDKLPWGVQNVLYETLELVKESKVSLTYGADYHNGVPCLINSVGHMLPSGGGKGIPSKFFEELVSAFDSFNSQLHRDNVNTEYKVVSPLGAEILLSAAAPKKDKPLENAVNEATDMAAFENHLHREPTDEEMTRDWLNCLSAELDTPLPIEMSAETNTKNVQNLQT